LIESCQMMKLGLLLVAVATVVAVAHADCPTVTVYVNNTLDLLYAFEGAKAGLDVILAPGVYKNETFNLNAKGRKDCPITISCNESGAAMLYGTLVMDGAAYVFIENISVKGHGNYGVTLVSSQNCVLDSVHVFSTDLCGLLIWMSANTTVDNCTFDNAGPDALALVQSDRVIVQNSVFGDRISSHAIVLQDVKHSTVTGNSFYGAGYTKTNPCWILVEGTSAHNVFSYNSFANSNNHAMAAGVRFTTTVGYNVMMRNFMVLGKGAYGFLLDGGNHTQDICATNRVFGGAVFTNSDANVDPSC